MANYEDTELVNRAMLQGFRHILRDNLRKEFQKVADEIIDEAVGGAMKDLEVAIVSYINPTEMGRTIKVILEDKRS